MKLKITITKLKMQSWEARAPRHPGLRASRKIENVGDEHQQSDDVFRVVVPDVAGEAVDPDEAERGADGDGDESDQDAALAHAIEKIERRETPDDIADALRLWSRRCSPR